MKITFLNVGQGDSIIIEWDYLGAKHLSIIDCNLYNNKNPVIEYLIDNKIKIIDHIILSHPHLDHFSGMNELLDYCSSNNITIKYFLHTCAQVPEYLKSAVITNQAKTELHKLFIKLKELDASNTLQVSPISGGSPFDTINLTNLLKLQILSPTTIEFDNFAKNTPAAQEEDSNNNPNANWLSLIFRIYSNEWLILLTSDAEKYSLIRLDKHHADSLKKSLILAQSPHHGSERNHNNTFWKKRNRSKDVPIIFSVGPNHYNHPSKVCIDFFTTESYSIYSTNKIGALTQIPDPIKKIEADLDVFSEKGSTSPGKLDGNKTFIIEDNTASFISI